MPVKQFRIEKVPLPYVPAEHVPSFGAFPMLYLELLENKEKVIPSIKDKEQGPIFLPNVSSAGMANVHPYEALDASREFFDEKNIRHELNGRMKKSDTKTGSEERQRDRDRDLKSARERTTEHERDRTRALELKLSRQKESRSVPRHPPDPVVAAVPPALPPALMDDLPVVSAEEQQVRNILSGAEPIVPSLPVAPSYVPTSLPAPSVASLPPSLGQIHSSSTAPVKNLSYSDNTDELKRKRELLFRFDILKKSYKDANMPQFSEYTDIATMEQVYEDMVRKVGLDSKVEGYKKFLTMGFFGIEFLFSNIFKVDMGGFAKQQLSSMNSYERILIELGEKAMLEKAKSQWPAEIRLLFTIVMNAVIFLLMKNVMSGGLTGMLGSLTGMAVPSGGESSSSGGGGGGGLMSGIMSMMSGLAGGGGGGGGGMMSSSSAAAPSMTVPISKPKGKMKGPSVNLDDDKMKTL